MFVSVIEFVLTVAVFPAFLAIGVMLFLDDVIGMIFEVHLLAFSVGLGAMAWALRFGSSPIVAAVARVQLDGIPLPLALLFASAAYLIGSFVAARILNGISRERQ